MNKKYLLVIAFLGFTALAWGDDPTPQSKNDVQKQGTSGEPSDTHIVGVKPITAGPGSQSSGELDSGNAPAMGLGVQFNLSKPKTEVTPHPNPSETPAAVAADPSRDTSMPSK